MVTHSAHYFPVTAEILRHDIKTQVLGPRDRSLVSAHLLSGLVSIVPTSWKLGMDL